MSRSRLLLAATALTVLACSKQPKPTTEPTVATEPATVVANTDAKPGDTTTCPYSGRTFVVKEDHPQVEYEGETYTICSDKAAEAVRADPGKYLDDFAG